MMWLSKIIRKITTGLNPGDKYMPALVRQPNMRQKELEQRIADRSSLSEGDVANVIKNMGMEMAQAFSRRWKRLKTQGFLENGSRARLFVAICNVLEEPPW